MACAWWWRTIRRRRWNSVKSAKLELQAKGWAGKLDRQDQGTKKRGHKLSDSGTKARFYHAVLEAHLGKIIKVDLKAQLFSYAIDEDALRLAEMMDLTHGLGSLCFKAAITPCISSRALESGQLRWGT